MVQILPPKTSLATSLGRALGAGAAQGIPVGMEAGLKNQRLSSLLGGLFPQQQTNVSQRGLPNAPGPSQPATLDAQQMLGLFAEEPELAKFLQTQQIASQKLDQKEREMEAKKESQFFKSNEPKLMDLGDSIHKLENEDLRFERLGKLFSESSDKMPSSTTAAIFSKEGQLRPFAASQLSPEAQEAIKLIIDSTSEIKDTYGARVTNFDLQTYLKKLPSLLNTPEGRQRIIRDLRLMNKLNRERAEGILNVFDEYGGPGAIPFSKAEQIFRQKNQDKLAAIKREYVTGKAAPIKELPAAAQHKGKKIRDLTTGQILVSDGSNWNPEGQ